VAHQGQKHRRGRSRGGLSTKIHELVDGNGRPLVVLLTAGQAGERLSPAGMAEVMSQELGRPVGYRRVSVDDFASIRRLRGAAEQVVKDMTEALAAQDAGIYDADWATARVTATDFQTWCREVLKPAVETQAAH
jgi:transposase